VSHISEASAQDLSNASWAFSTLHFCGLCVIGLIAFEACSCVEDGDSQALVNTAWAFSVLLVRHEPLISSISSSAIPKIADFHSQGLANTAWSLATLAVSDLPLMDALASAALRNICFFSQQDLANFVWAFANLSVYSEPLFESIAAAARAKIAELDYSQLSLEAAHMAALDFTALVWAFAFVNQLFLAERAGVLTGLLSIGREVDRRIRSAAPDDRMKAGGSAPLLTGQYDGYHVAYADREGPVVAAAGETCVAPEIVINRPGTVVVLKPVGWEVDSTGGGQDRPLLSAFVQEQFSKKEFPLVHLLEFGYGFLHRLDIPSSGLVLVATTFEGLYSLRSQLNTYHLARQYMTGCHGLGPPATEVVSRIDASSTKVLRSIVAETGKPSQTFLRTWAHLRNTSGDGLERDDFCVVVVNIRTGRRHQIRAHTRHIGHPTAADPWYCPEACVLVSGS